MTDSGATLPPSRRELRARRDIRARRDNRASERSSAPLFDFDVFVSSPANGGASAAERPAGAESPSDDEAPVTILMVCTGNICRSPMAEVLLRARLPGVGARVHSAGTRALIDHEMDRTMQEVALRHGGASEEAAAHRARQLRESLADDADLVLAMSREHRTAAVELSPRHLRRTFTVREFARLSSSIDDDAISRTADAVGSAPRARLAAVIALVSGRRGHTTPGVAADDDVVDPYRRAHEVYEESAAQLVPAVDEVARVLRSALR
ncbi:low molecular weight phosphatase family protein [Microbacterium sp. ZW T5_45]|uniref:arsenate reductase/protein-tyrosine-phosphatase family protein n=1 Tax=Microbacterium sp. ZW T5_45 TaxID=3378080 RepID=UPI0038523BCD